MYPRDMFTTATNDNIRHQLTLQFELLTGLKKSIEKKSPPPIPFAELAFINGCVFVNACREAVKRGMLVTDAERNIFTILTGEVL